MAKVLTFDTLYERAAERHTEEALAARMPTVKSPDELAATGDDRWLSMMTRCVFQAGFVYRVIESKWPGFEEAFHGFDPRTVASFDDDDLIALQNDTRIVRNGPKIKTVVDNARFVCAEAAEHGSFARRVADWPTDDIVGLWAHLKKGGSRLGGATGPRVLRRMGKDTFIFTQDVVKSLILQGIVAKNPTSKSDIRAAQDAFLRWSEESGRGLGEISMVLACSVPG